MEAATKSHWGFSQPPSSEPETSDVLGLLIGAAAAYQALWTFKREDDYPDPATAMITLLDIHGLEIVTPELFKANEFLSSDPEVRPVLSRYIKQRATLEQMILDLAIDNFEPSSEVELKRVKSIRILVSDLVRRFEVGRYFSIEGTIGKILEGMEVRAILEKFQSQGLELDQEMVRDLEIIEARVRGTTLDEIGREMGITRERVRQRVARYENPNLTLSSASLSAHRAKASEVMRQEVVSTVVHYMIDNPASGIMEIAVGTRIPERTVREALPESLRKFIASPSRDLAAARRWSDEQILEALRQASNYQFPLSGPKYDSLVALGEIDGPTSIRVLQIFGTWSRACGLAGVASLSPLRSDYDRSWSNQELLDFVGHGKCSWHRRPADDRDMGWKPMPQ